MSLPHRHPLHPGALARFLWALGIVFLLLRGAPAWAQAHESAVGGWVLRSSSVVSLHLAPETARKHGIERAENRAVLNVTVLQRNAGSPTAQATVKAHRRDLAGVEQKIAMREIQEGNRVSYLGSYTFVPGEVLRFHIEALPRGHTDALLVLDYEDRMSAVKR